MHRTGGLRVLSGLFALFAAAEVVQLLQAAQGEHSDPPILLLTHALSGLLAGLATFGLWKARSWAPVTIMGWGAVMGAMLMALGPVLDEPRETWRGFWIAAAAVVLFAAGSSWYARDRTRRRD